MTAGLSYAQGSTDLPLTSETIGACLNRIANTFPEQEAVVSLTERRRLTYRAFEARTKAFAKALMNLGVRRGDRVAIWSLNHVDWVVTQFATARIGAVLVNVNPAYRTHELEFVLRRSKAKVLLLSDSYKSSDYVAMLREVCPEVEESGANSIHAPSFPQLRRVFLFSESHDRVIPTTAEFAAQAEGVSEASLAAREEELDAQDVINIQYTSGTTGTPKGVLLTHHNILNNGIHIGKIMRLTANDRVCVPVPFYHCFGMVISNLAAISHGACVVIPSPTFDALSTLVAVQQERCTVLHGVPTMFIAELEHPRFSEFDRSTLRTGVMAGAPCPVELMRRVIDRMHLPEILIGYGQTEASPLTTATRPEDPLERRVATVGRVMPHQELKIMDPATGDQASHGTPGEICFRGYQVMRGYDDDPEATGDAIDKEGWLHSGDLGTMDSSHYVKITGRIKEMVIRGGENLYPREIEEFLHTLPCITDAQVVGVPDEKYGEELLACVKLRTLTDRPQPTTEEFREMCRGRIAHHKIPRYWMVVEEFPLTVTGKVQKFRIRELAIARYGLERAAALETA